MSNNTQSVIIYDNPYSKDFYESGMAFPLGVSLLVLLISIAAGMKLIEHYTRFNTSIRKIAIYICFLMSAGFSLLTFWVTAI